MRTIKFRIFDSEIKKYIDISASAIMLDELNNLKPNLKIEQFTGLHDKNGKEIYEGDIVTDGVGKYKIIYDLKLAGYQPYCIFRDETENYCEVIGNIYENPDLVKLLLTFCNLWKLRKFNKNQNK